MPESVAPDYRRVIRAVERNEEDPCARCRRRPGCSQLAPGADTAPSRPRSSGVLRPTTRGRSSLLRGHPGPRHRLHRRGRRHVRGKRPWCACSAHLRQGPGAPARRLRRGDGRKGDVVRARFNWTLTAGADSRQGVSSIIFIRAETPGRWSDPQRRRATPWRCPLRRNPSFRQALTTVRWARFAHACPSVFPRR